MSEPFDEYVDQFLITCGPFGAVLNFLRTPPKPVSPGTQPQGLDVGTIRMSVEHLKLMLFIMRTQVIKSEEQFGVPVQVPTTVLNVLGIVPEDWQKFWQVAK